MVLRGRSDAMIFSSDVYSWTWNGIDTDLWSLITGILLRHYLLQNTIMKMLQAHITLCSHPFRIGFGSMYRLLPFPYLMITFSTCYRNYCPNFRIQLVFGIRRHSTEIMSTARVDNNTCNPSKCTSLITTTTMQ
jgi:hypothetical protein